MAVITIAQGLASYGRGHRRISLKVLDRIGVGMEARPRNLGRGIHRPEKAENNA
jgi:hypothetical protein